MKIKRLNAAWLWLLLAAAIAAAVPLARTANAASPTGVAGAAGTVDAERALVVATIHPLSAIVREVGGSLVSVQTILPPGASPHTFEPRPAHVRAIADAALFLSVGEGLDDWALTLARSAGRSQVLRVAERVREAGLGRPFDASEPDDHDHGDAEIDPHVWLDPVIVRDVIAPAVAEELAAILPRHADQIRQNLARFRDDLDRLDAWIRERLSGSPDGAFISYHSAWGYFADRYGLRHVASVAAFPGQEPSARWVAQVVRTARELGVKVIFAEPQLSPKAAETIAREIGGQVLLLDPVGGEGLAGRESYAELLRYNAEMLAQAFASVR